MVGTPTYAYAHGMGKYKRSNTRANRRRSSVGCRTRRFHHYSPISRRVGCTRMTDIKRQQNYWARTAAYYLAKGEIAKALAMFDKRGMLKVDDDTDDALERLIKDWDAHSFDRLAQSRILTLTNDLAHQANQLAQQKLLERKGA